MKTQFQVLEEEVRQYTSNKGQARKDHQIHLRDMSKDSKRSTTPYSYNLNPGEVDAHWGKLRDCNIVLEITSQAAFGGVIRCEGSILEIGGVPQVPGAVAATPKKP